MRKLLITPDITDEIMQWMLLQGITEVAASIPRRYKQYVTSIPCVVVESYTQPDKILEVVLVPNFNTFTYDWANISELPSVPKLKSLLERIIAIEADNISADSAIQALTDRIISLEGR